MNIVVIDLLSTLIRAAVHCVNTTQPCCAGQVTGSDTVTQRRSRDRKQTGCYINFCCVTALLIPSAQRGKVIIVIKVYFSGFLSGLFRRPALL